jgi:hypothetical protein
MKTMIGTGKKFITSTVAVLFVGAALALSAAPAEAQEVPGCRTAWNDLDARDALRDARTLIGMDCPVMYRKGWLVNSSKLMANVIPSCVDACSSGLAARSTLRSKSTTTISSAPLPHV